MKIDTLVLIAAAGLGLWYIARTVKTTGRPAPTATGAARGAAVMTSWNPEDPWSLNATTNAATGYNPAGMLVWPN